MKKNDVYKSTKYVKVYLGTNKTYIKEKQRLKKVSKFCSDLITLTVFTLIFFVSAS